MQAMFTDRILFTKAQHTNELFHIIIFTNSSKSRVPSPSLSAALISIITSSSDKTSPMCVMRCLNSEVSMVPLPSLSRVRKARRTISASSCWLIFWLIMLQNSGNSISPEPSVSYSLMSSSKAFSVGFIPIALIAQPSSLVLMFPPPSTSNSLKACLSSAICSSLSLCSPIARQIDKSLGLTQTLSENLQKRKIFDLFGNSDVCFYLRIPYTLGLIKLQMLLFQ